MLAIIQYFRVLMATRTKKGNGKDAACTGAAAPSGTTAAKRKTASIKDSGKSGCAVEVTRTDAVDHSAIAHRAWEIWQREGCPEGRELEHWLKAEQELLSR